MEYRLSSLGEARTEDYVGTVASKSDAELATVKEDVRRHNASVRDTSRKYGRQIGKLRRVRLMGRGERVKHAIAEGRYPRAYDSYIPQGKAESFDVYVGTDYHNQRLLERELETGLLPSELKRLDELTTQVMYVEMAGKMRKRGQEIPQYLKDRM